MEDSKLQFFLKEQLLFNEYVIDIVPRLSADFGRLGLKHQQKYYVCPKSHKKDSYSSLHREIVAENDSLKKQMYSVIAFHLN